MKASEEGLYQCFGRIQGEHPIFMSKESVLAEKLVEEAHILTIHGVVRLTMTKIRSEYWILKFTAISEKNKKCYGAKDFMLVITQNYQ